MEEVSPPPSSSKVELFLNRKKSFAEVAEAELEVLYRVAKRMTRSDADAEDIVGQTLLNAFKAWDAFDGKHPRSWMIRILQNEWLKVVRKRATRTEVELENNSEPSDEGFWKDVDGALQAQMIHQAIDTLPEEYRVAVALCDVEELSYDEAASALSVPVGTIRSRLFRGRKLLRTKLVALAPQGRTL